MAKTSPVHSLLLRLIDEAFDKKAWHGPNLRGAIRRVSPEHAGWRPGPGRHSIAEIVVHCAYWKYAVRRRLRGDKRGSFPLKGSNWFTLPARITEEAWRAYVRLLDHQHAELRGTVAELSARQTAIQPGAGSNAVPARIYAMAMHDVYHAGQIQTIKGLLKSTTNAV
jgi:uncharacterized damage-inducible protein DinB